MMLYKTKFVVSRGIDDYDIFLVVKDIDELLPFENEYDLKCDIEIPSLSWYDIYEQSIKDYEKEILKK